jgi:PAP2 superfamily
MPALFRLFLRCAAILLLGLASAKADVITDWNEIAVAAGYRAKQTLVPFTRNVAMVHVAMFEAVNAITPRYKPYKFSLNPAAETSPEVAAVTVAHSILTQLYPDQANTFSARYDEFIRAASDSTAKQNGIAFGNLIAAEMIKLRTGDGVDAVETYQPATKAGVYIPTVIPLGSTCSIVTPWALKSVSQFRPSAPYRLSSEQYARDLNEVQAVGGKKSTKRSEEQTTIAKFWEYTGPGTYSPIARKWAAEAKLDLLDNARLFALFTMATADAYLAVFDAKYEYNFWRPVTAIRNGADDGNRATEADRSWLPLIDTPMHPEYPCAHCIASSTAADVLMRIFKSSKLVEVELASPFTSNVTRRFLDLNVYVAEIMDARVFGGVHFRQSALVGKKMGEQVAEFVVNNFLTQR